jgi:hypothetical protein
VLVNTPIAIKISGAMVAAVTVSAFLIADSFRWVIGPLERHSARHCGGALEVIEKKEYFGGLER